MSALLTADWCLLGRDTYYRKFEIYSMQWQFEISFDNIIIAAAPYAGPIAIIRDRNKFVQIHTGGKPVIAIYTASGKLMSSIVWSSGLLISLGWSDSEQLICIQEDGMVLLYNIFGTYQHTFSMGQEAKQFKVMDAKIFYSPQGTGIAILTTNYKIFLVNNIKEPKIRSLSQLPSPSPGPTSWSIISEDRKTEVLMAHRGELFRLRQGETSAFSCASPIAPNFGKVTDLTVSLNAKNIALFTDTGHIWMGTIDLLTTYCEIDIEAKGKLKQFMWCGTESVVCDTHQSLVLVCRDGATTSFSYEGGPTNSVHLSPEVDGVRILSSHQNELLQKVPPVVQKVLRINSTEPGSYLLEASKHHQRRSHRAHEYIGLVNDLTTAVNQCIQAAGYEFDSDTQKMLMRAAQFGKCFIADMNPDEYVKMCRELRVLNAVRDSRIGIPLTYTEMHCRKYQNLLDRLIERRHYYLAIQIAKYLKLPDEEGASRILVHWAYYKVVQTQLEWDVVAKEIANKLGYSLGISYSDIAKKAVECGRMQLAIKLLDYEPRARQQVPLLLRLGESKNALIKAIESGDTDLVYTVLFHMRDNMALADFQITIRNFPVAQALYIKHCRDHNPQALADIYKQEDDFNAQAACFIRESYDPKNFSSREVFLSAAQTAYKTCRNDLNASLCEETQRLIKHQKQFEEKLRKPFVGKSVQDTLYLLLTLNELKFADKMRSEYRVPDRRYWWLRIQTLAEQPDWLELERFSKSKKSPVGYAPFVDACLKHKNKSEANKYLPKVRDDLKVKYYVKTEKYEEGAQIAFEQKDIQGLYYIQGKCMGNDKLSEKINSYIMQLSSRK